MKRIRGNFSPVRGTASLMFFLLFFFPLGVSPSFSSPTKKVVVSILPQKYFVEQIAGNKVQVTVMVPPGANPAVYEPKPRQMELLSKAEIYFSIGVPFERAWLPRFKAANPQMTVVDTRKGIKLYPIAEKDSARASADNQILDPHIWLSPPLVVIQARNILQALACHYPEYSEEFRTNFVGFVTKLARLDVKLMEILSDIQSWAGCTTHTFMVFHPSWGYFARAYGLRQIAIEQAGKEPKPSQLLGLMKLIKRLDVKVILVQPQFSAKAARLLAESGGVRLVTADPLAYNWDENLLDIARKLKDSLK